MAVNIVFRGANGITGFTALSTDTLPNATPGSWAKITDTGAYMEHDGQGWVQTRTDGKALVSVANAIISEVWAGAGTTNAPDATDYANFIIGVNNGGASTANVYHVINGAWVDTGATVANLYGG